MSFRNFLANFFVVEPRVRGRVADLCPEFPSESLRQHCKRRTSLIDGKKERREHEEMNFGCILLQLWR